MCDIRGAKTYSIVRFDDNIIVQRELKIEIQFVSTINNVPRYYLR